jgi:antitoxin HicB
MSRNPDAYQFTVHPLSKEEGGGYLVEYADIPGCMSDGETIEEAIANGREALRDCVSVLRESGRKVPKPGILKRRSGASLAANSLLEAEDAGRE